MSLTLSILIHKARPSELNLERLTVDAKTHSIALWSTSKTTLTVTSTQIALLNQAQRVTSWWQIGILFALIRLAALK